MIIKKNTSISKLKPKLSLKRLQQIPLSKNCMQVLLGGLLGDGHLSLTKGYKNARYQIRHSWIQKEYFEWKVNMLKSISTPKSVQIQQPDGFKINSVNFERSSNKKLHFMSKACTECTLIWNVTHSKNKLVIKRHWLNHLTSGGLAVWWFDDGSIISRGTQGILCTDGFTKREVEILQRYLEKVWTVRTTIRKTKEFYRLALSRTQLHKFLDIISRDVPCKSMLHKMKLIYTNTDSLQRWISHLQELYPEWHKDIQEMYQDLSGSFPSI